ncbi:MAG: hypothetical protein U0872_06405 [Planctomycetaceae bacterium]
MSVLTLVRHGQAASFFAEGDYDLFSPLGEQQRWNSAGIGSERMSRPTKSSPVSGVCGNDAPRNSSALHFMRPASLA